MGSVCTKFQVSIVFRLVRDLGQTTTLTDRYKRPNNAFVTGIRPYLSMNNLFNLFASAGLSEYLGFFLFQITVNVRGQLVISFFHLAA